MRCWHPSLYPKLCRPHLLSCWRECLGMYKIITHDLNGYRNHPATKEYEDCPELLWENLSLMRTEMLRRGWSPKELPERVEFGGEYKEWQTLEQQIERIKEKGCECLTNKNNQL